MGNTELELYGDLREHLRLFTRLDNGKHARPGQEYGRWARLGVLYLRIEGLEY